MATEIIPLFAALQKKAAGGRARGSIGSKDKVWMEIQAPSLVGVVSDDWVAALTAIAIKETIKDNTLRQGRGPTGAALKGVSEATKKRRAYREAQAARGGAANPRYRKRKRKSRTHKDAKKNYRKRFFAPRVEGGTAGIHIPGAGVRSGLIGLESGLLWRSTEVQYIGAGSWGVYWANVRALTDDRGSSAVGRVSKIIPMWSAAAMRQPEIQRRLQQLAQGMVTTGPAAKALVRAVESKSAPRIIEATERVVAASTTRSRQAGQIFAALRQTANNLSGLGREISSF